MMSRTIKTFLDSGSELVEGVISLSEQESYHLSKVLRLQKGDLVEVLDGKGSIFSTNIKNLDRKKTELKILDKKFFVKKTPQLRLAVAIPKGNKWEEMIRPLTELGVVQLTPLLTDRCEYQSNEKKLLSKFKKWEKIAIEACKQSGNPWLPKFDLPKKFASFLQNIKSDETVLIGTLSKSAKPLKQIELNAHTDITLMVGPEGGWSEDEEKKSIQYGVSPFTLGVNTLRVENAAVAGLAVARERFIL